MATYTRIRPIDLLWKKVAIALRSSKRILMLLCTCFRFSKVTYQMFLTCRGAVQGSFRATLGVASVFVHLIL